MPNFAIGEVLDLVRSRHDLKSDYALGNFLGVTNGSIRNFRHGRSLPDERICGLLARAAGLDPLILAAQVQAQRSKTSEARSLWEQVALRLSHASAGLVAAIFSVLLATSFIATDARAASAGAGARTHDLQGSSLYIVSTVWTLLFGALLWCAMRFDRGFVPLFCPQP